MKTETLIVAGTFVVLTAVVIYAMNQNYNIRLKALGVTVELYR